MCTARFKDKKGQVGEEEFSMDRACIALFDAVHKLWTAPVCIGGTKIGTSVTEGKDKAVFYQMVCQTML